jgi:hypothetical protein
MLACPVRSKPDAEALLAGLWLWHDWLDEAHRIAQRLDTPSGRFWHAIMHRREGDFANSVYWYRRCAEHPLLPALHQHASTLIHPLPADTMLLRLVRGGWEPAAFVELVQAVHAAPDDPRQTVAVSLQQLEWRMLIDFCARAAAGK